MEEGKTILVTKVYDDNCEICKQMSRHDRALFEEFPEIAYQEVKLDDVINHGGNYTKYVLYQCLEKYALNPDYTIDLPAYVYVTKQGQYKGNIVGAATIAEMRQKTREILDPESS